MEALALLKRLGMTDYEAKTYLALAQRGASSVKEIVEASGVPRNKTYEALARLERAHKVAVLPISPRRYKIVDPEQLHDEVDMMQDSVSSLLSMIKAPKHTEIQDMFWIIKGQKATRERLAYQNKLVKREILSCNRLSAVLHKNMRVLREGIQRGVKVKFICYFDPKKAATYHAWLSTGCKLRAFNTKKFGPLLPRLGVFDGEVARLTVGAPEVPRPEDYLTLWTESKAFAAMLRTHFLNMWKHCTPVEKLLK